MQQTRMHGIRLMGIERTAMHQQPCGLVDDEQAVVLVQAAQGP